MIDFTKLREKLDPDPGGEDQLRIRTGVVVTDNADGTVDITLSGVLVPGVPKLADAGTILAAGATVQVLTLRGGFLILGASAGTAGQGARKVEAFNTNNPTLPNGQTTYYAFTGGDIHGAVFVAPASGSVKITVEGWLSVNPAAARQRAFMTGQVRQGAVINSGTIVSAADDERAAVSEVETATGTQAYKYVNTSYVVSGLTPGNSYNVVSMARSTSTVAPATVSGAVNDRRLFVEPW